MLTVEDKSVVVTLEKKLEDDSTWRRKFYVENKEKVLKFVLKQIAKPKIGYRMLQKAETGYDFYDNDPHYPRNHSRRRLVTWLSRIRVSDLDFVYISYQGT